MRSCLEKLPLELQHLIFAGLGYEALIHLSATNRHFNNVIDPQKLAHPEDKFQFVMRAAKDFPQHRPKETELGHSPGNSECYICFRVRSPIFFDANQPVFIPVDQPQQFIGDGGSTKTVFLRRFCIDCGFKTGLHATKDILTTKDGRKLWICECQKVWPHPTVTYCPGCNLKCPLRPPTKVGRCPNSPQEPSKLHGLVGTWRGRTTDRARHEASYC